MSNKICIIIPYFGHLPEYFYLWLRSCELNSSYDWIFISDNKLQYIPNNFIYFNWSFNQFVKYVQNKFDFKIELKKPYKICDFRPAFGYIFSEFIKDYTHWGHCDTDLIFGKIDNFITSEILNEYDRILTNGHFSIYKNSTTINLYFKTLESHRIQYNYRKIFSDSQLYAFDEWGGGTAWGGIMGLLKDNDIPFYEKQLFDDLRYYSYNFLSKRLINGYSLKDLRRFPSYYEYSNGILKRFIKINNEWDESESLYVHLQKRKMIVENLNNNDNYYIVPNKFISVYTSKEVVELLSKYKLWYPDYYLRRFNNLKNKVKKYVKKRF